MKAHVLKGSKQEIAENLFRISGEVREAIVFEEESAPQTSEPVIGAAPEIFAEMAAFMVEVADVVDSREGIYTRMERE